MELRTAKEGELRELWNFCKDYAGYDEPFEKFAEQYRDRPEMFVVAWEEGELIAAAAGDMEGDNVAGLEAIAVEEDHRGQGTGSQVLELFEKHARKYADRVSVASADNVEGFYRENGYRPVKILLQVEREELPENYQDYPAFEGKREVDSGTVFVYADFDEYGTELRDEMKERFNAFEVNTIYEKEISTD